MGRPSFELEGVTLVPQAEGGPAEGALKVGQHATPGKQVMGSQAVLRPKQVALRDGTPLFGMDKRGADSREARVPLAEAGEPGKGAFKAPGPFAWPLLPGRQSAQQRPSRGDLRSASGTLPRVVVLLTMHKLRPASKEVEPW